MAAAGAAAGAAGAERAARKVLLSSLTKIKIGSFSINGILSLFNT